MIESLGVAILEKTHETVETLETLLILRLYISLLGWCLATKNYLKCLNCLKNLIQIFACHFLLDFPKNIDNYPKYIDKSVTSRRCDGARRYVDSCSLVVAWFFTDSSLIVP